MSLITLSTDFGTDDPYVGIMKGVILGINPRAVLVDLTHGLSHHRLVEAACKLAAAAGFFPQGTVHLAVVDPGVGGDRRALLVKTARACWIGPDNGLFTLILRGNPAARIYHLTNRRYFLQSISHTFHGRDIFAPAAAHLSRGLSPASFGKRIHDHVQLDLPEPATSQNRLIGQVLYADRFGNLITNLSGNVLRNHVRQQGPVIKLGRRTIRGIKERYGEEKPGRLLALMGSTGHLEIACNLGNAAEMLGYGPGKKMEISIDS